LTDLGGPQLGLASWPSPPARPWRGRSLS